MLLAIELNVCHFPVSLVAGKRWKQLTKFHFEFVARVNLIALAACELQRMPPFQDSTCSFAAVFRCEGNIKTAVAFCPLM